MYKRQFTMIALLAVLLTGFPAFGDAARRAFEQGKVLYETDQFAEAANAFRQAYELKPSWKILYNIGQCAAAAKQPGVALEAFEAYLTKGGDEVPNEKRLAVVEEIRVLREMVGFLLIDAPEGYDVLVDGVRRGQTPLPGTVAVGAGINHRLEIAGDDGVALERTVRVSSGATLEVALNETEPADEAPVAEPQPETAVIIEERVSPPEAAAPSEPSKGVIPLRIVGFVSLGLGLGGGAGAAVTGMKTLSISEELNGRTCWNGSCDEDNRRLLAYQKATNILIGVGGTLAVAGTIMVIVSFLRGKGASRATAASSETLSIAPILSSRMSGISLFCLF